MLLLKQIKSRRYAVVIVGFGLEPVRSDLYKLMGYLPFVCGNAGVILLIVVLLFSRNAPTMYVCNKKLARKGVLLCLDDLC